MTPSPTTLLLGTNGSNRIIITLSNRHPSIDVLIHSE